MRNLKPPYSLEQYECDSPLAHLLHTLPPFVTDSLPALLSSEALPLRDAGSWLVGLLAVPDGIDTESEDYRPRARQLAVDGRKHLRPVLETFVATGATDTRLALIAAHLLISSSDGRIWNGMMHDASTLTGVAQVIAHLHPQRRHRNLASLLLDVVECTFVCQPSSDGFLPPQCIATVLAFYRELAVANGRILEQEAHRGAGFTLVTKCSVCRLQ